MRQLPDLGRSFEKMKLREKLLASRATSFGFALQVAIVSNQWDAAIHMVHDQLRGGNIEELEWCIGASTLQLLLDLYPLSGYEQWQLERYGNALHEQGARGEWNGPVRDYRAEQREMEEQDL